MLSVPPVVQPKLTVGDVGDRFEREADRVADRVMRMPDPLHTGPIKPGERATAVRIQRLCSECENEVRRQPIEDEEEERQMKAGASGTLQRQPIEEEEEELQAKSASGSAPAISARTDGLIRRVRQCPAQPLPGPIRRFMEPRFGVDFRQVRVHSGHAAAQAARSINARAFTLGRDVVFGAGQYAPETREGQHLLAHELTHVVQQRALSVPSVQRLTETEKAEDLSSQKYADNLRLERAFDDEPPLGIGESSEAVRLVQEGLVEDGFAMPISTRSDGTMDGIFGSETHATVHAFQTKHGLSHNGRVGRETLGKLDELARSSEPGNLPVVCEACPNPVNPTVDAVITGNVQNVALPGKFGNTDWAGGTTIDSIDVMQQRKKTCNTCDDGKGGTTEEYELCPVEIKARATVNVRVNENKVKNAKADGREAFRDCTSAGKPNKWLTPADAALDAKFKRKTVAGVTAHELYHRDVGQRLWIERLKARNDIGKICPYSIVDHVKWLIQLEKDIKADAETFLKGNPNEPNEELNARTTECGMY